MSTDYKELLKPEIINSIKGLELIARVIVDNYLSGVNRSRRVGEGQEFNQYRSYEPGDDIRLLDWKMLARSGRYYIKQSEVDTHLSVKFVLDASASMHHREAGLSKLEACKVLIASIAYLAHRQGDAIGLYGISQGTLTHVYPRLDNRHLNRFLHALVNVKALGKWPQSNVEKLLHSGKQKELIIFFTDMYEHGSELSDFISKQKTPRNELAVLHLMGADELNLNYKAGITLEDLETGSRVQFDRAEAGMNVRHLISEHIESIRHSLLEKDIEYTVVTMNDPVETVITQFLKRRKSLAV